MSSEAPSWQHMWGAKVRMPCDMEDDILEDAIKHITGRISKLDTEEWEKNGLAVSLYCQLEKERKKNTHLHFFL
jgi:hypothetical protein